MPTRLLDTRSSRIVAANGSVLVPVLGQASVPSTDVRAIAVTVTAVTASQVGNVVVYPNGTAKPATSTLNLLIGQTVANSAIVQVGVDGKVKLTNSSARPVHLLLDIVGYYIGGTASFGGAYVPVAPTRALDTRASAPIAKKTARTVPIGGAARPVPLTATVAYNLTAVQPAAPGNVRAYPTGSPLPNASNVNANVGQTVPNLAITRLGSGGAISLYNDSVGPLDLLVDVAGNFRS
jgi:hypothetical protein